MSERSNEDRRLTAQAALEAACRSRGEAPVANDPDSVTDLLADLRHFCAAEGIDYTACDRMAEGHWEEETFIEYLNAVDRLLEATYGNTSRDVDIDAIATAQDDGWTPQEIVDWIGEKHGLDSYADINWGKGRVMK